jgi:TonB family protein
MVRTTPQFPESLRKRGVKGSAIVSVVVTPEGKVTDAHVVSADDPEFGSAAVAAAENWVFAPARLKKTPVACRLKVPFLFTQASH